MSDVLLLFLIVLFCTPFGWVGMLCFGIMVYMCVKAFRKEEP